MNGHPLIGDTPARYTSFIIRLIGEARASPMQCETATAFALVLAA
jgi:hypothetical protein